MDSIKVSAIAVLAVLAALAAGAQPGTPEDRPAAGAPVTVAIRADKKTYSQRDPITLTLTAKNPGKSPVKLMFNSGMKYDFEIRKGKQPGGEAVWQWSRGRMFGQMILFSTLEPGKTLTFTEKFQPGEPAGDGKPLPTLEPGTYTATGFLALGGRAPRPMARTTFVVK